MTLMAMLSAGGQVAGGIAGLFGNKKKNPMKEANQYYDQIMPQMNQYYGPYSDAGKRALGNVQGEYEGLTNNPNEKYNQLAGGYQQSPGYKAALEQALQASSQASARGGALGTPQDQQYANDIAVNASNKDFDNYMQKVMGLYGTGLSGQQGLEGQGFDAATGLGNASANILGQKAQMAAQNAQGGNQARTQSWQNILSGLGSFAGSYGSGSGTNKWLGGQ